MSLETFVTIPLYSVQDMHPSLNTFIYMSHQVLKTTEGYILFYIVLYAGLYYGGGC
jgi:hypothetical protein